MTDDVLKGRKRVRRRLSALERLHQDSNHPDYSAPGHALAEGYCAEMHDQATPDETKAKRSFGAEAKIPVTSSDQDYEEHAKLGTRAGEAGTTSMLAEGQDPSSLKQLGTPSRNPLLYALRFMDEQNKGPGNPVSGYPDGSARQLESSGTAFRNPDLDQQGGSLSARLASLRYANLHTERGDLMGEYAPRLGGFSHEGTAHIALYSARADAWEYDGMNQVGHSPQRPAAHQAATGSGSNGSHSSDSQYAAQCPPRQSMKNSDRLSIMKQAMFGHD